jgi:hypothetical protein
MVTVVNAAIQVALFCALIGMMYCIVQVVDVIRDEKDRLMQYRNMKSPAPKADDTKEGSA